MSPCVNKTRKTSPGNNWHHLPKAVLRLIRRSRTKPEDARPSATTAVSYPGCPPNQPGQMPKAVATDFRATLDELAQATRHTVRRLRHRGFDVDLPETVGRKVYFSGAAPQ